MIWARYVSPQQPGLVEAGEIMEGSLEEVIPALTEEVSQAKRKRVWLVLRAESRASKSRSGEVGWLQAAVFEHV